jgi:AraC family transcriptional regulator of arabinose operon
MAREMQNPAMIPAEFMHDKAPLPAAVFMCDHYTEPIGYYTSRSKGRTDWLITYTVAGEGRYRLGGVVQFCRPGDVVLLAPGAIHDYGTSPEANVWDFYWAHFIPPVHWQPWLNLPEVLPGLRLFFIKNQRVRGRLTDAFERLLQDHRSQADFREILSLNALEEILILTAQAYVAAFKSNLDPRVEEVLRQLTERLSESVSVQELAEAVSLSPSRLAHLFKEQIGDSIVNTLTRFRLQEASRLLEFTDQNVAEIAQSVGFQSQFHFSRQFKAHYGVSPTTYRQQFINSADIKKR